MVEYIKREDVCLSDFEIVMCNRDYKEALKMLLEKVEKIPSADVMERKRGIWLKINQNRYVCSECNHLLYSKNPPPYCSACGADMRGW